MVSKAFHFTIHRCRGQFCHPSRGVQLCTSLRNKINKLVTKPVKLMWHLIWRWGPAVPSVGSEGTIVSRWKFGSPLLTNWFVRRTAKVWKKNSHLNLLVISSKQEVGSVKSNSHTEIVYAEPWWLMMPAAGFGLKSYLLPDLQAEVACLGSTK